MNTVSTPKPLLEKKLKPFPIAEAYGLRWSFNVWKWGIEIWQKGWVEK